MSEVEQGRTGYGIATTPLIVDTRAVVYLSTFSWQFDLMISVEKRMNVLTFLLDWKSK
jgi:hypothetical protein